MRYLPVVLLLTALTVSAQVPPRSNRLVNDYADMLTSSQEEVLEAMLVAFDDSTSTQICLLTMDDLQGNDILQLAYEIGETWGIGNRFDNGVVFLIKSNRHGKGEIAIAQGYGLESVLTDAICRRIIETVVVPKFQEDNYYQGIRQGIESICRVVRGEGFSHDEDDDDWIFAIVVFILCFGLPILLVLFSKGKGGSNKGQSGGGKTDSTLDFLTAASLLNNLSNSGKGFGGGFGSSGGFGGFGGGHFGGGGAKGGW